jgi:hypothetical protein
MLRRIGAIIAAIVAWMVVVSLINLALRHGWPAYASVEKAMDFTLAMMAARLGMSALSSLASGYVAAWIGRERYWAPLIAGLLLLLLFVPIHLQIWDRFPFWYHLTFLLSLPLVSWIGGRLKRP